MQISIDRSEVETSPWVKHRTEASAWSAHELSAAPSPETLIVGRGADGEKRRRDRQTSFGHLECFHSGPEIGDDSNHIRCGSLLIDLLTSTGVASCCSLGPDKGIDCLSGTRIGVHYPDGLLGTSTLNPAPHQPPP